MDGVVSDLNRCDKNAGAIIAKAAISGAALGAAGGALKGGGAGALGGVGWGLVTGAIVGVKMALACAQ